MNLSRAAFLLALIALPAWGATLTLDGKATQGGLLFGATEPSARVTLDGEPVTVAADGRFVIGFGRDAKLDQRLVVRHPDGSVEDRRLVLTARQYPVQRIDGLPSAMVTPPPEILKRIKDEQQLIDTARAKLALAPMFESGFIWPVHGTITGVYGSQRVLNGEPRAPHTGVDIAGTIGAPIVAPADGVVALAARDFYLTGGTLIIDHGLDLNSVFIHLSAIDVKVGQRVRQGERIGRMGQSGRATGPNLHWGINWRAARIDPELLVPPMPAN